ncbi:MAG TPA: cell division ATP-binding protein FtsE [Nevskiaceae bacterium]|nr:cell division ATP-binding protein FtsE [Nevskiaceae bacterium]
MVHLHKVSHRYPGGNDVLTDVSFTVAEGEMVFLTGASGAGKSTLLKLIALLNKATRGQIVVNHQNLAGMKRSQIPQFRQQIGFIFQNFNLLYDRTVFDNVALPLVIRGHSHADVGRKVRAALDAVGLLDKETLLPIFLSGGEQQRVGIARAVVAKPALILADEPTGNLDPATAREVMNLFARYNEAGVSVVVATHAIDLIQQMPDFRIINLERGQVTNKQPTGHSERRRG